MLLLAHDDTTRRHQPEISAECSIDENHATSKEKANGIHLHAFGVRPGTAMQQQCQLVSARIFGNTISIAASRAKTCVKAALPLARLKPSLREAW